MSDTALTSASDGDHDAPTEHARESITIRIDRHEYTVHVEEMTGEQLRQLPDPPIGQDRDLYLEVEGHHEDELIGNDEVVKLKDGLRFFTAPHHITPGHDR